MSAGALAFSSSSDEWQVDASGTTAWRRIRSRVQHSIWHARQPVEKVLDKAELGEEHTWWWGSKAGGKATIALFNDRLDSASYDGTGGPSLTVDWLQRTLTMPDSILNVCSGWHLWDASGLPAEMADWIYPIPTHLMIHPSSEAAMLCTEAPSMSRAVLSPAVWTPQWEWIQEPTKGANSFNGGRAAHGSWGNGRWVGPDNWATESPWRTSETISREDFWWKMDSDAVTKRLSGWGYHHRHNSRWNSGSSGFSGHTLFGPPELRYYAYGVKNEDSPPASWRAYRITITWSGPGQTQIDTLVDSSAPVVDSVSDVDGDRFYEVAFTGVQTISPATIGDPPEWADTWRISWDTDDRDLALAGSHLSPCTWPSYHLAGRDGSYVPGWLMAVP